MTNLGRIATEGVSSGYLCIDSRTKGFAPGELIVVAASRPEMGAHVFVINMAEHIAVQQKLPVCVFLMEEGATQKSLALLSSDLPLHGEAEVAAVAGGGPVPAKNPEVTQVGNLIIQETTGITLNELIVSSRHAAQKHGPLGLVVVDSLQLMGRDESAVAEGATHHSATAKGLKNLAMELQCPVIVMSQLKREVEKRTYKRPKMRDLRQWGALDDEADMVVFLYRDDYYYPNSMWPDVVEINFQKNPRGRTGKHPMVLVTRPVSQMVCVLFENKEDY